MSDVRNEIEVKSKLGIRDQIRKRLEVAELDFDIKLGNTISLDRVGCCSFTDASVHLPGLAKSSHPTRRSIYRAERTNLASHRCCE